jgi:hypothetical protein
MSSITSHKPAPPTPVVLPTPLLYYKFDTGDFINGRLKNWATGIGVEDASIYYVDNNDNNTTVAPSTCISTDRYKSGSSSYFAGGYRITVDNFYVNTSLGYALSYWIFLTAAGDGITMICFNGDNKDVKANPINMRHYDSFNVNVKIGLRNSIGTGQDNMFTGAGFNINNWNHICVSINTNGNPTCYLNNVLCTASFSGTFPTTRNGLTELCVIGSNDQNGNMKGHLDEWRFYNKPLSAEEVDVLYKM